MTQADLNQIESDIGRLFNKRLITLLSMGESSQLVNFEDRKRRIIMKEEEL